jgi:hypothetical protein
MRTTHVAGQLLIILIVLAQSCSVLEDCNELQPITHGADRFMPYESMRTMYFESVSGKDTLIVSEFSRRVQDSPAKCTQPYERMDAVIHSTQAFTNSLMCHISNSTLTFSYHNDPEFYFQYNFDIRKSYWRPNIKAFPQESITVGGQTFSNVIVATCDACSLFKEVIIAENLGIVAYKLQGVQWVRIL